MYLFGLLWSIFRGKGSWEAMNKINISIKTLKKIEKNKMPI